MAVALNTGFYNTLPALDAVEKAEADIAWFIYDLQLDPTQNRYMLARHKTVYTKFEPALVKITRSEAGEEASFLQQLQTQLNRRLTNGGSTPPDTADDADANAGL